MFDNFKKLIRFIKTGELIDQDKYEDRLEEEQITVESKEVSNLTNLDFHTDEIKNPQYVYPFSVSSVSHAWEIQIYGYSDFDVTMQVMLIMKLDKLPKDLHVKQLYAQPFNSNYYNLYFWINKNPRLIPIPEWAGSLLNTTVRIK